MNNTWTYVDQHFPTMTNKLHKVQRTVSSQVGYHFHNVLVRFRSRLYPFVNSRKADIFSLWFMVGLVARFLHGFPINQVANFTTGSTARSHLSMSPLTLGVAKQFLNHGTSMDQWSRWDYTWNKGLIWFNCFLNIHQIIEENIPSGKLT